MQNQTKTPDQLNLPRPVRVGLLGSPYFWGSIDFQSWEKQQVECSLLAFEETQSAGSTDLLLQSSEDDQGMVVDVYPNPQKILRASISAHALEALTPMRLVKEMGLELGRLAQAVRFQLQDHGDKYLEKETVIARYATEMIRVTRVLDLPPVHIENEALLYLATCPWRNEYELGIGLIRMAFYNDGDVLRDRFVRDQVHRFGTSVRGINNCDDPVSLIHRLISDVSETLPLSRVMELFKVDPTGFSMRLRRHRNKRPSSTRPSSVDLSRNGRKAA